MQPDRRVIALGAAATRRSQEAQARARSALRALDARGEAITFQAVAHAAGVSRQWLYTQPELRDEIEQLRAADSNLQDRPVPARERASATCGDRHGNTGGSGNIADSPNEQLGDHRGALFWSHTFGPVERRAHPVFYLLLVVPAAGTQRLEAELVNDDLPDGRSWHAWDMSVPIGGNPVTLIPVRSQRFAADQG